MTKKNKIEERVDAFISKFSREGIEVRNVIASTLPAYNQLLNMHARTFEEFALMRVAEEQGLPYTDPLFDYSTVRPPCPACGAKDGIRRENDGYFRCSSCKKRYRAHNNSLSSDTHCSSVIWLKVLHSLLNFMSQKTACKYCDIHPNTYFNIRNKLFFAMRVLLDRVKLYGNIEADITFVRASYRGMSLEDSDFPEDSMFDETTVLPREARKRGGSYSYEESNKNSVAIFTAIDDRGHVLARFTGLGKVTTKRLVQTVPSEKFLPTVPKKDPFPLMRERTTMPETAIGATSLLKSDGESAIEAFATSSGLAHNKIVFNQNGKTLHVLKNGDHIQHINSLHSRLKKFLNKCNNVSSRYLPGYLTLFEFIENCGASDEAIRQLFMILAEPNLRRDDAVFEEMFCVPNIYVQWLNSENPLKNIHYRQLVAYKMYAEYKDQIKENDADPILVKDICNETGYSAQSIRRIYKDLNASGYDEVIRQYFGENEKKYRPRNAPKAPLKGTTPIYLAFYDAFAENRKRPPHEQKTKKALLEELNKNFGTKISERLLDFHFGTIVRTGTRDPLPAPAREANNRLTPREHRALEFHAEYQELQRQYREKGLPVPATPELAERIGKKHGLSAKKVLNLIHAFPAVQRKKEAIEAEQLLSSVEP